MQSPFLEIRGRIDMLRANLEEAADEFKLISDPDFDPMTIKEPISGFSRFSGTPNQFYQILQGDAAEAEADYQLTAVAFCLRMMEISISLIELQNRHKKDIPEEEWDAVNDTISQDSDKFLSLTENAGDLRLARERTYPTLPLDEESYRLQYLRLFEDYENAQGGQIKWIYQYASKPPEIVEYIFDARLAALDTSIASVEMLEERIQGNMADYAMIRVACDEGIIKDSPLLLQIQKEKEDFCKYNLPRALAMVNMLEKFTIDLQEMGTDELSHEDFTVERYKPVSIGILPKITP